MMTMRALVFALCFWASIASAGEMSRAEKEAFLKIARVRSVEEVGIGATRPLKVVLEHNGRKMKAIFKAVDMWVEAQTVFSGETTGHYVDSYRSELAAYELDRLLGLDLLPPVEKRRIRGKDGSLREWIDDVMPRYGHGQPPPDPQAVQDRVQMMWLFDYLIANADRRAHNVMLGSQWRPVYIDHSMAFGTFRKMCRPLYRFPKEVIEALQQTDAATFRKGLKPYLREVQIEAFLARRDSVLALTARRVSESDAGRVFYSLADIR